MNRKMIIRTTIIGVLLSFGVSLCIFASSPKESKKNRGEVIHINAADFSKKIVDISTPEWKYLGDKPCVLDFYASWCGPCRMISPYLEELAKEYKDKIYIYKINVDNNKELAQAFGASSIPLLVFIPQNGQAQASRGAMPKAEIKNAIETVLLKK